MGKKKIGKKTTESSVAIDAESSSMGEQLQQLQQTPRKRGRPRKLVIPNREEQETGPEDGALVMLSDHEAKRAKTVEELQVEEPVKTEKAAAASQLEEGQSKQGELPVKQPPRSKAKRKSKPRKSS